MGFAQRKRDSNEKTIVAALVAIGAVVTRIMGCVGGDYGCPDLLVGFRGITLLLEVKDPSAGHAKSARSAKTKRAKGNDGPPENAKGQLTPTQVEWWKTWTGGEAYVVETPEEAVRFVRGDELPSSVAVTAGPPPGRSSPSCVILSLAHVDHHHWMSPGQADALAGALHEQAGAARGLAIGAAAQAKARAEHIAVRSREVGDAQLESLCDLAIAGDPDALAELDDHAANNPDLAQWVESGRANGFRTRDGSG